ncbi:MAG TPA: DUF1579 domain-containing protein [Haliangiales bacterium]|nr:DUF1579 domain-containing protein [Haliangiales bacterium]
MKRTVTIACLAAALLGSAAALAQTETKPATKAAPKPDAKMEAEQKKMMDAWQKYGTPGAEHQKLKAMAGTWDAQVKMWVDPAAPAEEVAGKAEMKMILGDRFLQQEFSGSMMGQPFNGLGFVGFDNVRKKWISGWMDSTATGFYGGEGTADKSGNVITFATIATDPMTGKQRKGRDVWRLEAPNKFVFESYGPGKGGKEYKMLEITYTKK